MTTLDDELPRYVKAAEAAAIMGVNPKTIGRWANEGKLPFLKTLGGHHRYPEAELRAMIAANTVTPEHPQQ